MTCRHETCEEPKASGRVYCEEHYWQWRRPDHDLHKANRLAHRVAGLLLESRDAYRELWTAIDDKDKVPEQALWVKLSEKNNELEAASEQYKKAMEAVDG